MRPLRRPAAPFPPRAVPREDAGPHRRFRIIAAAVVLSLEIVAIAVASSEVRAAHLILSWTDNSSGAAATRLERRPVDTPGFVLIANVPAGVTQYIDATLDPGKTYCYRAAAYDGDGASDYSAEACGTALSEVLSVTVKRIGGGMVVSDPNGLVCGATCAATYPASTVVALIPLPGIDSVFIGWSGGPCVGTAPCTVTGSTAVFVTAIFGSVGALPSGGAIGAPTNPVLDAINQTLGAVAPSSSGR